MNLGESFVGARVNNYWGHKNVISKKVVEVCGLEVSNYFLKWGRMGKQWGQRAKEIL